MLSGICFRKKPLHSLTGIGKWSMKKHRNGISLPAIMQLQQKQAGIRLDLTQ